MRFVSRFIDIDRIPLEGEQGRRDSNPQPPVLETGALPIELLPSGRGWAGPRYTWLQCSPQPPRAGGALTGGDAQLAAGVAFEQLGVAGDGGQLVGQLFTLHGPRPPRLAAGTTARGAGDGPGAAAPWRRTRRCPVRRQWLRGEGRRRRAAR